ncbi:MAG: TrkH family potassium uptake protein [Lachnospiraceae bacterium]|nr:TrkH family potassium uptake protein [Lachnospiraceae bacterium]
MNYPMIFYILSRVLQFQGIFMALPCITALIYREHEGIAYLIVMAGSLLLGTLGRYIKRGQKGFYAREGLVTVAFAWILMSLVGALPFVISGEIPSFVDAFFESISGFTTTGASILTDVEAMSKTGLMWRSFTHWIGGMGVLVFLLAFLPMTGGSDMYLMKAESPGPSVGKLVPRIRETAQILYGIYIFITIAEVGTLLILGMSAFESLALSFATAGTGGFGILNSSVGAYTWSQQSAITIFMILFGVNFNVYFLFLMKKPKQALKCEELRYYVIIIVAAIALITANIYTSGVYSNVREAVHHSAFQVGSIMTTTGFSTADFNMWPTFSKTLLVLLMFIGACAGSTGGGMKVSRWLLLIKSCKNELGRTIHPRSVHRVHFEGRPVEKTVIHSVERFLVAYILVFVTSCIIVSLDTMDFTETFTSVAATLNNIGPGLGRVGAAGNYASLSVLSKSVLMFDMLAGRLEILPMLVLILRGTWKD